MTERAWQRTFIWGTVVFVVLLLGMTYDTLKQVNAGRTPAVSDQVAHGKWVFQRKNCNDCHTILGIGGYYAPDLTKEADRRDAAWLAAYLADPQQTKPGTTMPDQKLAAADVADVVAFLDWVRHVDTNGWPPKPLSALGAADVARPVAPGAYEAKGCAGCHAVDGKGAAGPGPDLSHIGSTPVGGLPNTADYLARWLANPAALKPGSTMPATPLTGPQVDSLVRYLTALK